MRCAHLSKEFAKRRSNLLMGWRLLKRKKIKGRGRALSQKCHIFKMLYNVYLLEPLFVLVELRGIESPTS